MNDNVLAAIGNTPLVHLQHIFKDRPFHLYAKLEGLNPGGSTKDRPALTIIKHGLETGLIRPDTVVVESSSGNMGIGLAQICSYYGLRFICVVDPKTTEQNLKLLKVYGAEVDRVEQPDPATGEYLQARINRVQELRRLHPNNFWPNQYGNVLNPRAHHQTMREILAALNQPLDYLFCATSTCGTLRGCAEYIHENGLPTKVIAVDALGSVIFGGQKSKRLIPGHGAAIRPELFQDTLADRYIHVTDIDCVIGCRRLVRHEAILAGGSSGAVLMAVEQIKHEITAGANCVAIFPDRGERYLDTIYCNDWLRQHFSREQVDLVSNLWQGTEEAQACMTMTY
ncbi:MAG TPA: 2,3-diaminopropionate biosynthesis protein SbnA [Pyrinomonadaceae bacterium]|jgi:cysteine synthase A